MKLPYEAGYRSEEGGQNGKKPYCVEGIGNGFGYNGGTLWPKWSLESKELAEACAEMCNEAYKQGAENARRAIRKELGL